MLKPATSCLCMLFALIQSASATLRAAESPVIGTGFFVSPKGHLLTNHHVVSGCSQLAVQNQNSAPVIATLTASDPVNDLALLATSMEPPGVASFDGSLGLGQVVHVYGYPLSGLLSSSGNFTSGTVTAVTGLGDDTRYLQLSAPVQPGNSGGALLTESGKVGGIVSSKLDAAKMYGVTHDVAQNVNFAIKASIALAFLQANGIKDVNVTPQQKLETAHVVETAQRITVKVMCEAPVQASGKPTSTQGPGPVPDLMAATCDQLWFLRNEPFALAGYCFKTPKAIAVFGNKQCVYQNQDDVPISSSVKELLKTITAFETIKKCGK